jgi:hypothetical protein
LFHLSERIPSYYFIQCFHFILPFWIELTPSLCIALTASCHSWPESCVRDASFFADHAAGSPQSALVGRAALFACGVGVGLFPLLGLFPIYMWRLPFALILFVIHIIILTVIICSVYFATRKVKTTHAA